MCESRINALPYPFRLWVKPDRPWSADAPAGRGPGPDRDGRAGHPRRTRGAGGGEARRRTAAGGWYPIIVVKRASTTLE